LAPPGRVEMSLVDGPVERFSGLWVVQPLSDAACKVSLALSFSVSSMMLSVAVKVLFDPLADDLVNSLVKRAHHLYQQR
jgi:ribosome-associated toxin RatA of RatAB toxin-antitoxin module